MAVERSVSRLVFPAEAIDDAPFRAFYEQIRHLGEEQIDAEQAEVTFYQPGGRGGRIDSLERLLVNAGLPYNLYCSFAEEKEILHYWRPGMSASVTVERFGQVALSNFTSILSVRRACDELACGRAGSAFGR